MDTDAPGNVRYALFGIDEIFVTDTKYLKHAGYDGSPEYNVTGFSQLHDDGTGGVGC
jgi:hypothetical protein